MFHSRRSSRQFRSLSTPSRPRPLVQLRLEELETRLVPSVDVLSNTATPDVRVLNSGTASSTVTPASLAAGFSPQQISQAYGFNQISFSNGTIKGDAMARPSPSSTPTISPTSPATWRPSMPPTESPPRRVSPWSTRRAVPRCPPPIPTGAHGGKP